MIELENAQLRISILDPVNDRSRLGPRFCGGGYIYQVEDRRAGPLFSGPEYPSAPSVINGQGIPDVFQFTLYHSPDDVLRSKLIIGVGLVENREGKRATESHFGSAVESYTPWRIAREGEMISMATTQLFENWSLELNRSVALSDTGWEVVTEVRSTGLAALPIRWFTHPFFPLNVDFRCCRLPSGTTIDANPGFTLSGDGILGMRPGFDWNAGCYTHLRLPSTESPFSAELFHPGPRRIRMELDVPPMKVALWANGRTFSLEPFVERLLAPGESARWAVQYALFPE